MEGSLEAKGEDVTIHNLKYLNVHFNLQVILNQRIHLLFNTSLLEHSLFGSFKLH